MTSREFAVEDEEGSVDSSQKRRLLELRRQIDDREDAVLSEVRVGGLDADTAAELIGDAVRRYLRALEPLLRQTKGGEPITDDQAEPVLEGAKAVFLDRQLGTVTVPVPSEVADLPASPAEARGSSDCWVSGTPPRAKEHPVTGLLDVIQNEVVVAEWDVTVRRAQAAAGQAKLSEKTVTNSAPMSRGVLQNAVRTADVWVQEVGLGIDIDQDGLPMATGFDQSGEDASVGLDSGRSDEAPDL